MDEEPKNENEGKVEEVKESKIRISLIAILLVVFIVALLAGIVVMIYLTNTNDSSVNETNSIVTNSSTTNRSWTPNWDKPIIYLYPEEETEVSVKLGYSESLIVSYPEYNEGWNVIAESDGTLTDVETGRELYSLYYESEMIVGFEVEEEGFVVSSEDTVEFLEEKLAILGLTEREAEEFIIYWLPKLQENEYNYIRFATEEEIEENMPLTITPEPDTVIRVLMTYKGLDEPIEVEEQELETPERTGFVAVKWGGTEIE